MFTTSISYKDFAAVAGVSADIGFEVLEEVELGVEEQAKNSTIEAIMFEKKYLRIAVKNDWIND
jgi:hypothetical protein